MIVQAYRTYTAAGEWLRLVDDCGLTRGESPDGVERELKATGQRLPDGWESTPYGVPIIPEPIPKPEPLRPFVMNVYRGCDFAAIWPDKARADEMAEKALPADPRRRVACVHVWTDEDGNDHAEVERV